MCHIFSSILGKAKANACFLKNYYFHLFICFFLSFIFIHSLITLKYYSVTYLCIHIVQNMHIRLKYCAYNKQSITDSKTVWAVIKSLLWGSPHNKSHLWLQPYCFFLIPVYYLFTVKSFMKYSCLYIQYRVTDYIFFSCRWRCSLLQA